MPEMKHTPGKWSVFGPNVLDSYTIHTGEKPNGHNQICQTPAIGDARLIAAAPDLLEAAIQLSKVSDSIWTKLSEGESVILRSAWLKMDAAIARATQE